MRHCCEFKPDDTYYLYETPIYVLRKLSIGFCPICQKPVSELVEISFTGSVERTKCVGYKAQALMLKLSEQINYSARECNYRKIKSKPFGWKYGVNKSVKIKRFSGYDVSEITGKI